MAIAPQRFPGDVIYAYLRDAAGAGTREMNIDGSITPVAYDFVAPVASRMEQITMFMQCPSKAIPSSFGGLPELANGCYIEVLESLGGSRILDADDAYSFKTHQEFSSLAGVDVDPDIGSPGDDTVSVKWSLNETGAGCIMPAGAVLRCTINDDLTGLSKFWMMLAGYRL